MHLQIEPIMSSQTNIVFLKKKFSFLKEEEMWQVAAEIISR